MLTREPILPQSTRKLVDTDKPLVSLGQRHPGLQLDKLSPVGDGKMEAQKSALVHVTKTLRDEKLLEDLLARRDDTLQSLKAQRLRMTTRGSLTLHLSRSGALENAGIALHPVYGFVYLPGSGIKGLARAWAETVWAPAQHQIEEAFGWSPGSERHKTWRPSELELRKDAAAGRLVFHDAWPVRWPRLIVDVINNHHDKYYKGQDDPGDWEDPTLVYFLAVGGGEEFEFAISDRRPANDGLLEEACGWLKEALITEGAGAKTAAGYGRFKPTEGEPSAALSSDFAKAGFASESFDLKLVTPAFLAGADQKREDCDLRPATLRGLLRWWWRTMHAAHLDRDTLKRLETAVWGDAESGSPVRIAVDSTGGHAPSLYDHKDGFQPKQDFKRQNDLGKPLNKKTTQGLFYASYGMDDDRKTNKKRWYRPAEMQWSVRIDARRGWLLPKDDHERPIEITPANLLRQAVASLWLLCRFGGVGSKGRKGFGSFEDIQIAGIADVEGCKNLAQKFRKAYQLPAQADKGHSPAIETIKTLEIQTPWYNPWTALDQLGYAVQAFAQKYAHKEEKKALGLPRKIHGPLSYPIGHQSQRPETHKPPKELSAKKGKRHAAPVHYHLAKSGDGKLVIRAAAFPAHYLPSFGESERMLDELLEFLDTQLKRRAKEQEHIGQRAPERQRAGSRAALSSPIEEANRIKGRIQNLRGKGDVSQMQEIVKQIAQLSDSTARRDYAEQLREWLKRGGKKSLWKDKKHASTEWRKKLDGLLE